MSGFYLLDASAILVGKSASVALVKAVGSSLVEKGWR